MKSILIIGAGFSGTVSAVHLLRNAGTGGVHVILVNRSGPMARGIAYGTQSPHHLLNVPAGNMSALADDPDHFLRYCRRFDADVTPASFVSRQRYGDYLAWLLNDAEDAAQGRSRLTRIVGDVASVVADGEKATVTLIDGQRFEVDRVLLGFGHYPPRHPLVRTPQFYASARYVRDPWAKGALDAIDPAQPLLLLGTGLTAVDVATQLLADAPGRVIHALSRRGLLPQPHRASRGVPPPALTASDFEAMGADVRSQVRGLRRYIAHCATQGQDWRDVIGALRPLTRPWWERLPAREKARFLRHVQAFWDIHRHRVAPAPHALFQDAVDGGAIRLLAGRLLAFEEHADSVDVHIRARGAASGSTLRVGVVINCTGPNADLRQLDDGLVRQLLADGIIQADAFGLGLAVDTNAAVIGAEGQPSAQIFYVGPLLKARYWEATAVPELRLFAQQVARHLLATL